MKQLIHFFRTTSPALLFIFILGGKPAPVKGQEAEEKEKTTYTIKVIKDKDGSKVVLDTTFTWVSGEELEDALLDLNLEECNDDGILMKVQKSDNSLAYVYCISEKEGKGVAKARAISKTICSEKEGVWTITSDDEGDMRLVVNPHTSTSDSGPQRHRQSWLR